jgi:hypothetical protein
MTDQEKLKVIKDMCNGALKETYESWDTTWDCGFISGKKDLSESILKVLGDG